jgi:outer membrane protein OmpA-like peptidoglycan-associated protein
MQLRYLLLLLILIAGHTILAGQSKELKELKHLVNSGRFAEGLQYSNSFESKKSEYYYHRGVCNFQLRQVKNALEDLSTAYANGYDKNNIIFYLARTHHLLEQFNEAAQAYKLFLTTLNKKDPQRDSIKRLIKQCGYAIKAIYYDQPGFVENLGPNVNSVFDEYSPVFSVNYEKKIYFSSNSSESTGGLRNKEGLKDEENGFYSSDIYAVEMENGEWRKTNSVPPFLNSSANEDIQDFCGEGNILIFNRTGGGKNNSFFADTFSTELTNKSNTFKTSAVSSLGDQDLFFINDTTILFSSKRKGGYGGYDLYISERVEDTWKEPMNLGPQINSLYDERSPFLTKSSSILYFSSNRENSLGGFDIFQSTYGAERRQWHLAENIGYPISSPGDDLNFRLGNDGRSALFSSDRMNTYGGKDIYIAYLKDQVLEQNTIASFVPFLPNKNQKLNSNAKSKTLEITEAGISETRPEFKTREIVISPLYFSETTNLNDGNNLIELKNLVDILLIYPETKIVLSTFSVSEGNRAYELYFSIKNAEIVSDYMIEKGIDGSRISLFGYGSQYPMVLDKESSLAKRNNQRIDILLINDNPSLIVGYNNPTIVESLKDARYQIFKNKLGKATFRIVAAKSRQLLNDSRIIQSNDVATFKSGSDETYTYLMGMSESYDEILALKNKAKDSGLTNLSISAFIDGFPIEKNEVKNHVKKYPNLKVYLDKD